MEILLTNNKKIIISKKFWKNKNRLEICEFRKKKDNWIPTNRFINVEFSNAVEIYKIIGKLINGEK